ncbi:contact-dependent growth inhibition system immunity protein [Achromobacter sp. NFACC18-2]|uniref:contact-dependent growth inhibition system immunity protein n=1 Tax=Achromobacter sp. NFACC18-2 TaxID=1564112 RepID=UPI0008C5C6F2|nr:contact-dependent growth inhibition system immunity protein [Achromobacter sp. NFACC18-2]SEJ73177.1 hypothetical protein SAMN03159494_03177 [Achromobacter sp. NFACC18-2]
MTSDRDKYPALETLLGGYFHEDYDLFGETLEEIVGCYKQVTPGAEIAQACREMDQFLSEHGPNAALVYSQLWGSFDPAGRGYTIPAFFDALKRILAS